MAVSVQQRGGRHQLRVKHRLLPKPFFFTFDTDTEARTYGEQLQALLAQGIVPAELLVVARGTAAPLLVEVIRAYSKAAPVAPTDEALLGTMLEELVGVRVDQVSYQWAEQYVRGLKLKRNLAPSTIRKRVGALARALDWHHRSTAQQGVQPPANALRLLPRGYSTYSTADAKAAADKGLQVRRDQERDRRLLADEEQRLRQALAGQKREGRQRALDVDPAFTMLLQLILHTGLRLREAYRLRADQVSLQRGVIDVEGSKGHRGVIKPRTVPIVPALEPLLREYCRGRIGLLFPFWSGQESDLKACTARLSARFAVLFSYAGVDDFTEHDLRHEATCRWVELRHPRHGGWVFSDTEICRIMGWRDTRMMLRYASLRGEDLAARLR